MLTVLELQDKVRLAEGWVGSPTLRGTDSSIPSSWFARLGSHEPQAYAMSLRVADVVAVLDTEVDRDGEQVEREIVPYAV